MITMSTEAFVWVLGVLVAQSVVGYYVVFQIAKIAFTYKSTLDEYRVQEERRAHDDTPAGVAARAGRGFGSH